MPDMFSFISGKLIFNLIFQTHKCSCLLGKDSNSILIILRSFNYTVFSSFTSTYNFHMSHSHNRLDGLRLDGFILECCLPFLSMILIPYHSHIHFSKIGDNFTISSHFSLTLPFLVKLICPYLHILSNKSILKVI